MRNNETGEFELVVGNRQLLSGFFIVVLLFAVFFAMGYILGQNSPRSAKLQADTSASGGAPAGAADSRPQPAAPAAPPSAALSPATGNADLSAAGAPADAAPQPTTQPVREAQAVQTVSTPAPAAAPPAAVTPMVQELPPGSYWQVRAVTRADAEIVVRTLKDKGFPALMTPGPNNLVRVLVGPYADTQAMGRAKTELENAGFTNPLRR
jgi:cell division septation protein DedD